MRTLIIYFVSLFFCIGNVYAEGDKKVIPKDNEWEYSEESVHRLQYSFKWQNSEDSLF